MSGPAAGGPTRLLVVSVARARRTHARGEAVAARRCGADVTLYAAEPGLWTEPAAEAGVAVRTQTELLWRRHWPQRLVWWTLFAWQLAVFRRVAGGRYAPGYRFHAMRVQRLVDKVYRRVWRRAPARELARLIRDGGYHAVLPTDPAAIVLVAAAAAQAPVAVVYTVEQLPLAGAPV